jgi:flagellar basal-body rod protein FlgB
LLFDTTQAALEGVIAGTTARHQALAANLANANTPGYQRVDVDFHSRLAAALGSGEPASSVESMAFQAQPDAAGATRADGSSIDVDAESAKLAANALEHQAAVQIASTRIQILKVAMGASS